MNYISSLLSDNPFHTIVIVIVLIGLFVLINRNPPPDGAS